MQLAIGDLGRQQHVTRICAEAVFGMYKVVSSFFLSFKIMFEWLQKFIFSWYSVVFHLAVSNLRLGFGFGWFFFRFCSPKNYPVGQ